MQIAEILITIVGTVLSLVILILIFKNKIGDYLALLNGRIAEENTRKMEESLKKERERFFEISEEKMRRNEQYVDSRKDIIRELVGKIDEELNKNNRRLEETEKERIGEFANLKTVVEEHRDAAKDLRHSTEDLKKVLSNNQLRGKYGEEVAENILKMLGFRKGDDYTVNVRQETNINRPDLTIKLPDGSKVNIDVKFPYQALVKYQEAKDKDERNLYMTQFAKDVKEKIKQVTSRDYINPEEKTLDFVILFVPNEMVFSVICDQLSDISEEAMRKKVIIAGPFSFAAITRMIRQSYNNFCVQEDLRRLVGLIAKFKEEFGKYNIEFDKLGERIGSAAKQYESVSTTRTRQLNNIVDKIDRESEAEKLDEKKAEITG
ncbi:MAG: DNA recombination protein RmuC [Candidatus Pacebacteria bacterium]|jgi:DNA recombination protein RmuC|nr:DNA recombination protein RmuC [Candidatus Paceibacterota bacterium]